MLWQFYHERGLNLRGILGIILSYKCTEPKDRIFAVLAFLRKETAERIEIDYCIIACPAVSFIRESLERSFRRIGLFKLFASPALAKMQSFKTRC